MNPIETPRRVVLALLLACALPATARAAADEDTVAFAQKAASGGLMEVRLGELAGQNASSDLVRAFGKRMATDHAKANQELAAEAERLAIVLPTEPEKDHAAMVDRFRKLSGTEFDREYMEAMVEDHEKDVKAFRDEAERDDSPLRGFAMKTIPTLEAHLEQARQIVQTLEKMPGADRP
jgi:putative membrane protein